MRSIREVADQEVVWELPARMKRAFELRAGDAAVATLRFQRGTLADVQAANYRWTFKRSGFWHPRVTARLPGSEIDSAIFRPSWMGGGMLELPDGRAVQLAAANMWRSEWVWEEIKDAPRRRVQRPR